MSIVTRRKQQSCQALERVLVDKGLDIYWNEIENEISDNGDLLRLGRHIAILIRESSSLTEVATKSKRERISKAVGKHASKYEAQLRNILDFRAPFEAFNVAWPLFPTPESDGWEDRLMFHLQEVRAVVNSLQTWSSKESVPVKRESEFNRRVRLVIGLANCFEYYTCKPRKDLADAIANIVFVDLDVIDPRYTNKKLSRNQLD